VVVVADDTERQSTETGADGVVSRSVSTLYGVKGRK
jgi:hypothetical protein